MSAPTGYTVDPPTYTAPGAKKAYGATSNPQQHEAEQPLLGGQQWASGSQAPRNDWDAEGSEDDIPDDFKIGVTVSQSSQDVRAAFVRKVYGVLFVQILSTVLVGWLMSTDQISAWVQDHRGLMLIPMIGALFAMGGCFWKRHSHPLNLVFLGIFTLFEAATIGSVISYFNSTIVLQAMLITVFLFAGLTLFTLQSKWDFDGMAPYLFGALLVFFFTGIVGLFIPYSKTTDMIIAGAGVLLFSAYIIFDTHTLFNRLHVDDWVIACVSLYLDIINLFLQILRLLSDIQDR
ncbi:inhibitor of apoptosis-promoting Bax1-domain-containing protein [Leucosporidium creatinivorum]|uniref:Inhibitor of apoptosis-promoting Bax1-domain-containing protein n=1 Tax=Leucosporidium creatinivorum TaxID=106004 RepID=A0A1Y2DAN7_9BASI|nr:inhibitor of apoptosis-promoting Bax1-domain-containing protein [Leucosporidium creatinivorum]